MSYPYKAAEKWDVHVHTVLSPSTYESLSRFTSYAGFVRVRAHATKPCCAEIVNNKGEVMRPVHENAYDSAARVKDCDKYGVTMQVLSPTPMMIPDYVDNPQDAAEICRILNDDNAEAVARFPNRFTALGAIPFHHADLAIKELERIKSLGMRGIEINSNIDGRDLDDPAFFPVFEAAQELGMAIFVHPWGGFMTPSDEKLKKRMNPNHYWRPWLTGMALETGLAFDSMRTGCVHERLPKLRVLYAHGGGVFPAILGRLEHGAYCRPDLFPNAPKLNPYETVRQCGIYTDSIVHNPWVLDMLLKTLGEGRVAMGSDYPYPVGEMDPFLDGGHDLHGSLCPYPQPKGIYPGHMAEHLPEPGGNMKEACSHFPWLAMDNLPTLTAPQKDRILFGTAKEWLGVS